MNQNFLSIVLSRPVMRNALKVALIVGTVLVLINQGDKIFSLSLSYANILQFALTYLVPYCVSTYSAVKALQEKEGA